MNFSVNGQSQVPPGFRFHPTEEELLNFYLRKKVLQESFIVDVIPYVDLNKLEPWDIQEMCKIVSTPQNEWYFFSHKDKKYPTGTRTNRATDAGFWKATGRDKIVYKNVSRIGLRKTLVFYIGRAPCGQKSDWIMYEYRLDEIVNDANDCNLSELKADEGWVVCRLFKKRNHLKVQDSPQKPSTSSATNSQIQSLSKYEDNSENDGDLHQIIRSVIKPCKTDPNTNNRDNKNISLHYEVTINSSHRTATNGTLDDVFAIHSRYHALEGPCNLSVDEMLKGIEEEFEKELIGHIMKTPAQVCDNTDVDGWSF